MLKVRPGSRSWETTHAQKLIVRVFAPTLAPFGLARRDCFCLLHNPVALRHRHLPPRSSLHRLRKRLIIAPDTCAATPIPCPSVTPHSNSGRRRPTRARARFPPSPPSPPTRSRRAQRPRATRLTRSSSSSSKRRAARRSVHRHTRIRHQGAPRHAPHRAGCTSRRRPGAQAPTRACAHRRLQSSRRRPRLAPARARKVRFRPSSARRARAGPRRGSRSATRSAVRRTGSDSACASRPRCGAR